MEAAINDISFLFVFHENDRMQQAVRQFIHLCGILESGRCHLVTALVRGEIDKKQIIGPNCSIYELVQRIPDRVERSYFLSLLTNRGAARETGGDPFVYHGKKSTVCARAAETGILVSLESDVGLSQPVVRGKIRDAEANVDNISREEHLRYHRKKLGLRIYEANSVKHKKERENYYGKGKAASPMDLDEEDAQRLLDRAVRIKGRLYARKGVHNYAFQETGESVYHGYIADDLQDDILRILYRIKWDR